MTDMWKSYVTGENGAHNLENNRWLTDMGYTHRWVNHSENFVNPDNGAHTQGIEGAWEVRVKHHLKKMRGIHKDLLPSYLDMYLWKSWFCPPKATVAETFKCLVDGIKRKYN